MKIRFLIILLFCYLMSWGQAILPVTRTTWNSAAPLGWTDGNATNTSYNTPTACNTSAGRLDNSTEYYQVFFDNSPGSLSYLIRLTGAAATSSLLVEESLDGLVWTTVINHTGISGTICTSFSPTVLTTSRYFRWTYTKASQNLVIDDVVITLSALPTPEMLVEGNALEIVDNDLIVGIPDGTNFGTTPVIGGSITRTFTIRNTGLGVLNLTNPTANVVIGGTHAADFDLSLDASSPISSGGNTTFQVTFDPSVAGLRNANIFIDNNDSNENPYNFNIQGNGSACSPTATITTITPTSGPVGTQVIINGTGFTGTTQVKFGSGIATYIVNSATQITAIVPAGASTGNVLVADASSCPFSFPAFTLITNVNTGCDGASTFSDLIISEVYDSDGLNVWHMELYNPTASPINLGTSNYTLKRYGTVGDLLALVPPTRTVVLTGVVNAGATFYLQLGNSGTSCGGPYNFTALGGGINEQDEIVLAKNGVNVDKVECPNEKGYSISRNVASTGPTMAFNAGDWTYLLNESCTNLSLFPVTPSVPPVTSLPTIVYACNTNSATITVTGAEGVAGLKTLTYQWFVSAPGAIGWTELTNFGVYSGTTTAILNIATLTPEGTQYYCQIRENDATCFVACNATIISLVGVSTQWNGTAPWTNGPPTLTTAAIINGTYNTGTNGSFDACNVTVNTSRTLTIAANTYVNIQNGLVVNGTTLVQNNGSLIQINNTATNIGVITYERDATVRLLDYVYWSAPVTGQVLATKFSGTPVSNIWQWEPRTLNANSGEGTWTNYSGAMTAGKGYIVRAATGTNATVAATVTTSFTGAPHNGTYTPTIERGNDYIGNGSQSIPRAITDDNWNLVGNPYPSAIDVLSTTGFLDTNPQLVPFIKIWTHTQLPTNTIDPFYQDFVQNYFLDYTTYNRTGATSGSGDFKVAGGQGFMVLMVPGLQTTSSVTFNNSMRSKDFANNQFSRIANARNSIEKHRFWIDLVSPTETTRTLVGYIEGAEQGFDATFDAFTDYKPAQNFYSIINDNPYAIQGKALPFVNTDVVPMGIKIPTNGTYSIGLGEVDGLFTANAQTIYLEDKVLNVIHNLNTSKYSFTANGGTINDRFVIRYTNTALYTTNFDAIENQVSIFGTNNSIKINANSLSIKSYIVYNVLGQILASENNINKNNSEITLIQKNNQPLIVKTILENGQVVTKKIIF